VSSNDKLCQTTSRLLSLWVHREDTINLNDVTFPVAIGDRASDAVESNLVCALSSYRGLNRWRTSNRTSFVHGHVLAHLEAHTSSVAHLAFFVLTSYFFLRVEVVAQSLNH